MVNIIAEIGINHNGDLSIAKKLIDLAKKTGFDSVKFQKRDIETVYDKNYLLELRESPWGKTQFDQKKGLEFGEKDYKEIDEYCKKNDLEITESKLKVILKDRTLIKYSRVNKCIENITL